MTTPQLIGPGENSITRLWETAFALSQIDLNGIARSMTTPVAGPQHEFVALDSVLSDPEALQHAFADAMDALEERHGRNGGIPAYGLADAFSSTATRRPTRTIRMTAQVWREGFEVPQHSSPADLIGWCFLYATKPRHEDSGSVSYLDPRAGSEGTAMPGLPWGRETTFRPSPGLLSVAPGWLSSTVRPLEDGQLVIAVAAMTTA
ncbi:hypothetical protein [Streptomyces tsukubensis]|uniref:hypothetical protein n=1 Tax=Streptomyces tsukubensis TaxID=83656 RepID=UPI003450C1AB